MPALPTAIVLGIEEISAGLTVVRELGRRGVRVHGIAKWRTPALYSRWLTKGYVVPTLDTIPVDLINHIAEAEGPCFLLSTSEIDTVLARHTADAGGFRNVHPLLPSSSLLRIVNDKEETYRIAEAVGVPVPRTWRPQTMDEAKAPPASLSYPCVVKFADPVGVTALLKRHDLPLFKFRYCYNPDELSEILFCYGRIGAFPLVQEFCPGQGLVHMLFMHHGNILARFVCLRVAEWPPEGGVSAVVRGLAVGDSDPLLEKSEAMLRLLGWNGAANVEYRYDPNTRNAVLMEINGGRFWANMALPYHSGLAFGWLTYSALGLNRAVVAKPGRTDLTCRSVDLELRRLHVLLFRRQQIQDRTLQFNVWFEVWAFLLRFLRRNMRYYIFSLSDPLPSLADAALKFGRLLRGRSAVDAIAERSQRSQTPTA
jgi:predicted ATP-grasp superfamily ATP-dependent carboligase